MKCLFVTKVGLNQGSWTMKEQDWGLNISDDWPTVIEQDEFIFRPTNEGIGNGFTGG